MNHDSYSDWWPAELNQIYRFSLISTSTGEYLLSFCSSFDRTSPLVSSASSTLAPIKPCKPVYHAGSQGGRYTVQDPVQNVRFSTRNSFSASSLVFYDLAKNRLLVDVIAGLFVYNARETLMITFFEVSSYLPSHVRNPSGCSDEFVDVPSNVPDSVSYHHGDPSRLD